MLRIDMKKVRVYSQPTCMDCNRVKEYLNKKGVDFEDINVARDKPAREEMLRRYGTHVTPVVVIGDNVMIGFNGPKLDKLLPNH
jgi:glutaredoxin-like YruB-family protein